MASLKRDYKPNNDCQKSQRMYLTAYYIHNALTNNYRVGKDINLHYCIGYKHKLLSNLHKTTNIQDAIVIWEHKEIIQIIREFNIKIDKWHNKLEHVYDLIFLIDVNTGKLYRDCYSFITNQTSCSKDVSLWLKDFDKIDEYFHRKILQTNNTDKIDDLIIGCLIVYISICIVIVFCICCTIIMCHIPSRRGYVQIA